MLSRAGLLVLVGACACAAKEPPRVPVAIATVADSAALAERVGGLWQPGGQGGRWLGVASLRTLDSVSVQVVESTLPAATDTALVAAVRASLVADTSPGTRSATLEIEFGERPRITARRVQARRPELANEPDVLAAFYKEVGSYSPPSQVVLWVRVTRNGGVEEVQVHRSSGSGWVDAAAVKALKAARFRPAQLEKRRVPVWVEIPLHYGTR